MLNGIPYTNTSAVNAAATITLPAIPGHLAYQVDTLAFSYSAAPTGGLLTIADGTTILHTQSVTSAGAGPEAVGFRGPAGRALTITLAAGGAGIVGRINASVSQAIAAPDYGPDPDATAFLSAAAITDTTQRTAIDNLVKALKSNGTWAKYRAIYPMVGGNARSHSFNLRDPRDLDAAFRVAWSGDLEHSKGGVRGRGGWGDTFYTDPASSLGCYSIDAITGMAPGTVAIPIGRTQNSGNPRTFIQWGSNCLVDFDAADSDVLARSTTRIDGPVGFIAYSYSPGVEFVLQRDRLTIDGKRPIPTLIPGGGGLSIALLAGKTGANIYSYQSSFEFSLFFIAGFLTRSELANDQIAFQAYQAALGRAVRGYGG